MSRIYTEVHSGKIVLIEDFSHLKSGPEFDATMQTAREYIASQPPASVLIVTDVTGVRFDQDMLKKTKDFTVSNTPHIKSVAVVGIAGLLQIGLLAVIRVTGRSFKLFENRESAIEWLVNHK